MKPLLVTLECNGRVLYEARTDTFRGSVEIGRAQTCSWRVSEVDPSMSGRHAELFVRHGAPWVRDLGSRNGITCAGERVRERRLRSGDRLHLGACTLSVEPAPVERRGSTLRFNRLEQLNGPDAGRVIDLPDEGEVTIGSDGSCAVPCVDPLVSRHHAAVTCKADGSCWARDLGSRNGTTVNGTALAKGKERMLRDGDVLSAAYVEFRFSDKNVEHPRAHLLRKLGLAAATVAVTLTAWYSWASIRPSARALLKSSLDLAAAGRFADAAQAATRAGEARGADAYSRRRSEVLSSIEAWRATHEAWGRVRALLSARDWDGAQAESVRLRDWNWNAADAPREGIAAERALALVRALRSAQRALSENAGERGLSEALSTLDSARSRFAGLFDSASPDWAAAMLDDSSAVLPEIRETLRELSAIGEAVSAIAPGSAGDEPHAAADAMEALDSVLAGNVRRREERESSAKSGKASVPPPFRASRAVEARVGELRAPVGALAGCERVFIENATAVAAGRFDDVRRELPLPSAQLLGLHGTLPVYAAALRERNEMLCGTVLVGWRARLETLRDTGLDASTGARPAVLSVLLSPGALREALAFVSSPALRPARVGAASPVEGCAYDAFFGIVDFFDFVDSLDPDSDPGPAIAAYGSSGDGWEPVLSAARRVCAQLRSFRSYAEARGEVGELARLVLRARVPGGTNVISRTLGLAGRTLVEVDLWTRRALPSACAEDGSGRARLLERGVSILLAARPDRGAAAELASEWRAFKRSVPKWDGSRESAEVVFRAALPGFGAHRTVWNYLHREIVGADERAPASDDGRNAEVEP